MTQNWLPTIHLVHPDGYEISESEEFALSSIFAKNSCSVPKKWNRADFTPLTNSDAKYFNDVLDETQLALVVLVQSWVFAKNTFYFDAITHTAETDEWLGWCLTALSSSHLADRQCAFVHMGLEHTELVERVKRIRKEERENR